MTYASWEPRHRVTTIAPGKLDLFVVTLIDGKRAAVSAIVDYEEALAKARAFHRDHPCQIKVLPMTGEEMRNLFNLCVPDGRESISSEDREMVIGTLTQVAREGADPDARRDAFDLLTRLGALQS